MPKSVGEMIIKKQKFTIEMWIELLENRKCHILPLLKSFILPELGAFKSFRGESEIQDLNADSPQFSGDECLLRFGTNSFSRIQGIFYEQPAECIQVFDSKGVRIVPTDRDKKTFTGIKYLWGITRSGDWVLVKIDFVIVSCADNSRWEQALAVDIKKSDPEEILSVLQIDPMEVFINLWRKVNDWTKDRHSRYIEIRRLNKEMEFDNKIVQQSSI